MYFTKNKKACLQIGKMNKLEVLSEKDHGIYLDGLNYGKILLPNKYIPPKCYLGDILNVFIYKDSEDRLIATTEKPLAMVGEFAFLKAVSVNNYGAFLDWGLQKDLMVPFREQKGRMLQEKFYVVRLYLDNVTERIVASTKLNKFIEEYSTGLEESQEVDLLIYAKTRLGFNAIINNKYSGIIYKNETFQKIRVGEKLKGYIKNIRDDNKIDLTLSKTGDDKFNALSKLILEYLNDHNGVMKITGKSSPETIENIFSTSKRNFKVAIGNLYKKRVILIEEDKIILIEE